MLTKLVTHIETDARKVALTFDDGPEPEYTVQTLSVLKAYGASATFFMVGEAAKRHPNLVRQVSEAGHAIGNHSWSHERFPLMNSLRCCRELKRCHEALHPHGRKLFRPPFGMCSKRSNLLVRLCGYVSIGWCVDAQDWCEPSADVMMEKLVRGIRPGCIILLHDRLFVRSEAERAQREACGRVFQRESMLVALEGTLKRLNNQFEFVTVPTLLRSGRAR